MMVLASSTKPKMLVVELWGLGDLAIAAPFLEASSSKFDVTLLAKPYARELAAHFFPLVRVLPFVAPWTAFRRKYRFLNWPWAEIHRLRALAAGPFDVGLSARWDPRDHFFLRFLRVKERIGFARGGSRILLTRALRRPGPASHRYDYWRVAGRALGLNLPGRDQITPSQNDRKDLVVVHSGAGQRVRVWPLTRYRSLVGHLRGLNYRVLVACDADQRNWWLGADEPSVVSPSNVTELIYLLDQAGVFIGNDSGPGHLAAMLGVPTFTLFGPQVPARFAPLHHSAEWLEGGACPYKPCSDYCRFPTPVCIEALGENEVCSRVVSFTAKNLRAPSRAATPTTFSPPNQTLQPRLKLALSILCENPLRRTGLSTLFPAFVNESLRLFPEIKWLVFAGPDQLWPVDDPRVEVVRRFPANDHLIARLRADHFYVGREAKQRGASALLTVGFCPLRPAGLPTAMHVFTVHHLKPGGGIRAAYRRWAINHGLRYASVVIANSKWTASHLLVESDRLVVSYEGLSAEVFHPNGPTDPAFPAGSYLLWASNFYPYKRAELALAAYARLSPELRSRFPLVLVGGDWNGGRQRAQQIAEQLGVTRNLRFLGWVGDEQLPALYRGARAHLLSTAEETFGRTVLEAMACGCPCVLQDLPVLREVTADSAMFVDFNDPASAGADLEQICGDDVLFARLRVSGLERAKQFSFARLATERMQAVLRMLGQPRG